MQITPFKRIAIAFAFSPGRVALLTEARRLMELQNAELYIIHAGEQKEHKNSQLDMLLERLNFDLERTHIRWEEGDPAERVAEVCRDEQIDLIIAGALKQQNLLQYYLGSVTRRILRQANCSVLVLREPGAEPARIKELLVCVDEHPRSGPLLAHAVTIGKVFRAKHIRVLKQALFPKQGLGDEKRKDLRKIIKAEEKKVHELLSGSQAKSANLRIKITSDDPLRNIADYARKYKADLLVLPAPTGSFTFINRVFRRETEFLLTDLPCNLLLLKDRAMLR